MLNYALSTVLGQVNPDLPAAVIIGVNLPNAVPFDPGLTGAHAARKRNSVNRCQIVRFHVLAPHFQLMLHNSTATQIVNHSYRK